MTAYPSYMKLHETGEMIDRIDKLSEIWKNCHLCPRMCYVDRTAGVKGICDSTSEIHISSAFAHFGEEPPLTGRNGSGTVFLTNCNLRCAFCQNYEISHLGDGQAVTTQELARTMMELQNMGCHNINFVTPTHYAPAIVKAIDEAARLGLSIPIVWNCGGYESLEVIKLLDGIVDIYMPDIKFLDSSYSGPYRVAPDYPAVVKEVVREMWRQVGDLAIDQRGIARRGLLIRHLVMPNSEADTESVMRFIAGEISTDTYVNIMDQYRPVYRAMEYERIARPITAEEYNAAVANAKRYGLHRGF